jgi:3-methyladenine DNA glycosylase/8-oxoguanine DNA glycosylase
VRGGEAAPAAVPATAAVPALSAPRHRLLAMTMTADRSDIAAAPALLTTRYAPPHPVDLRATLGRLGRGPSDPTTIWDDCGLWRTFRTPDGPATLRLVQRADAIDAAAWGPGAEWAIAGVPELLGEGDDWSGLDVSRHALLRDVLRRNRGLRLTRTRRVFEALVPAVIEQRVTSTEAFRSFARLVRWFGEPAPGPGPEQLRVTPSAESWRRIPSWEWHRAGVDPGRGRTVTCAARAAASIERTTALDRGDPDAARGLRSLPGIGVWTAAEALQRAHGDPDAISIGDYNLCKVVGYALIGTPVDDDGMCELLAPWAGQRQRVVRLIEASGVRPPRRGPRSTITDHRAW